MREITFPEFVASYASINMPVPWNAAQIYERIDKWGWPEEFLTDDSGGK